MSDRRGNHFMHSRLYQYQRDRRNFAWRVYLVAAILVVLSTAQWFAFWFVSAITKIFTKYNYLSLLFLFLALLVVTVFVFVENIRFTFPINWILTVIIVELVTLGMTNALIETDVLYIAVSIGIVAPLTILFIIIGIYMPRDLTLDVVILFVCSVLFFLGAVLFLMLAILAEIQFSVMIYAALVMATVLFFLLYHAQTINGSRYAEMRLNDYLLASLIIYHDYVILYFLTVFMASAIFGKNLIFNIYLFSRNTTYCPMCTTLKPPSIP